MPRLAPSSRRPPLLPHGLHNQPASRTASLPYLKICRRWQHGGRLIAVHWDVIALQEIDLFWWCCLFFLLAFQISPESYACSHGRAVGRSENPGMPLNIICLKYYLLGIICPPEWDRVNWSAKFWGCHGNPDTPGDDRPAWLRLQGDFILRNPLEFFFLPYIGLFWFFRFWSILLTDVTDRFLWSHFKFVLSRRNKYHSQRGKH